MLKDGAQSPFLMLSHSAGKLKDTFFNVCERVVEVIYDLMTDFHLLLDGVCHSFDYLFPLFSPSGKFNYIGATLSSFAPEALISNYLNQYR